MIEKRNAKILFGKNGNGFATTKITLPVPWIKAMGFTEDDRNAIIEFKEDEIIIKKEEKEMKGKTLDVKTYYTNAIVFIIDELGEQEETITIDFDGIDFDSEDELEDYIREAIIQNIRCEANRLDSDSLERAVFSIAISQNHRVK